ncbi:MAG: hypothetical protein HOW73_15170 [Polyangiaceae bacterium]|nr:hypothetical protein [Polyangiaceae bacterium]
MTISTRMRLASLVAMMLVSAACTETATPNDSDDGGSGGTGATGAGGEGGDGGEGASVPACDTKTLVTDDAFAPTSGPSTARFEQVAATADVVIATTNTALHRSLDGGETWSLVTADEIAGKTISAMGAFGSDLFVATWEEIYRSTDGETWTKVSDPEWTAPFYFSAHGDDFYALAQGRPYQWDVATSGWVALPTSDHMFDVMESDGTYLYANSIYDPGVYRLELAAEAAEWTAVADLPQWGYKAFAFFGERGFAANDTQVFRTEDGGATWAPIGSQAPADVQDFLIVDNNLFAATHTGLFTSADEGAHWTKTEMGPLISGASLANDGTHLFAAANGLLRASGAEGSWSKLDVLADSVWMLSAAGDSVISGSPSGAFRTVDGGASWHPVALPEGVGLRWSTRALERDGTVFALGTQAVLVSKDDGASFEALPFQPEEYGVMTFLASIDAGIVLGVQRGAGIYCQDAQSLTSELYLSTDGGKTWSSAMGGFPSTFTDCYGDSYIPAVNGLVQSGDALLATTGYDGPYRSDDQGASWTPIVLEEGAGELVHFETIGNVVVGASDEGGVFRSLDHGATWQTSLEGVKVGTFLTVGSTLFAGAGDIYEVGEGSVYYSVDSGASWERLDDSFDSRVLGLAVQGDKLLAGTAEESTWAVRLACAPEH